MAIENFKPTIWAKKIELDLPKLTILQENCNTNYQGEVGLGKRVKIIGAGKPTVGTYTPGSDINAAETPADTSIYLDVDQYKYTHFKVDDVDKAQAEAGVMEAYMQGSNEELAEARDTFIAGLSRYAGTFSTSAAITTAAGAKTAIDAAFVALWDNSVKIGMDVAIEITPWYYNLFKDKLTELYTNNVDLIKKGIVGMYNGAMVKISNNLYNDGTDDYMMIRTKNAIAFAAGISSVEPYRPEKQFGDAIKVLDTYGGKVARPKEFYVIKARKA